MLTRSFACVSAAAMLLAGASSAPAAIMQLDINGTAAQATDTAGNPAWGGLTHSGSVTLSQNSPTNLAGVFVDGVNQGVTPTWGLTAGFSVVINLDNGVVTGGSIFVEVTDGPNTDTYSANISPGSGTVQGSGGSQTNPPFMIDGLTVDGFFSATTFAGVDVTPWTFPGGAPGWFLNFEFRPNASGFDSSADIDIFIIPAPGAVALLACAGLFGVRRRR